jgi:hypothetical protein
MVRRPGFFILAVIATAVMSAAAAAATSRAQLQESARWNARVDAVTRTASALVSRTDRLDQLSRQMAAGSLDAANARLRGAAIIADLRERLKDVRAEAKALPPPPVTADQTRNKASQAKRLYAEQLVTKVAEILETSISIFEAAMAGEKRLEKRLYTKFSHQMIVLLEAENETNRAAIASQPADPLHPQYHLLSCIVETNEAMVAIWQSIIDVSHGQDAARIHARVKARIVRAANRVKLLASRGREQVEVYRKLFGKGLERGEFPKAQVDLLNRMMDTYEPAYEVEEKIAAALLAWSELPNMAEQTDDHRRRAEKVLGTIGPLAEQRERLQARRTQMAGQL